jgi:adenylosuccinate lyase
MVFPERMKENMNISKGLPMAESLMTALIEKGMGRGDAHELMRKTALQAVQENKTLKEMFLSDTNNLTLLSKQEIDHALNPENYLGVTDQLIDRVLKKLERA